MTRSHLRRCSFVCTLAGLLSDLGSCPAVRKSEVRAGDMVLVRTRNSVYALRAQGRGEYRVSGGWFDRHGLSPFTVGINGCTWGGRAIKWDIVAAPGLHLEFGNQVITSRIMDFRVIRCREGSIH